MIAFKSKIFLGGHGPGPRQDAGFTLIEILVALTILGFVMAMVAPRFGGIVTEATQASGKTNEAVLKNFVTAYLQDHGHYPGGLINIVSEDAATGDYRKPSVSDQDPDNGPEVLAHGADARCRFRIHYLNAEEAAELRGLGIVHVYNLNSPYDRTVGQKAPAMARVDAGTAVLMIGGGDEDGDGTFAAGEVDSTEPGWGEPDLHFCMVFGLGGETNLIKKGYIFNGSSCPEASMAPKNYAYKWYSLVLPRLKATVRRLNADEPYGPGTKGSFLGYQVSGPSSVPASGLTRVRRRKVNLFAPQRPAFFSIINSCGEKFHPSSGKGYWGIDFDANGDIH